MSVKIEMRGNVTSHSSFYVCAWATCSEINTRPTSPAYNQEHGPKIKMRGPKMCCLNLLNITSTLPKILLLLY
jgi:hypothetical protein